MNYNILKKETLDQSLLQPYPKNSSVFYPSLEKWYGELKVKSNQKNSDRKKKTFISLHVSPHYQSNPVPSVRKSFPATFNFFNIDFSTFM
jgi:hypothetical protein